MHHPCKMHYNYAQRYSASMLYPQRASSLLKASFFLSLFQVFVGCRLCWKLLVSGEGKVIMKSEIQSIKVSILVYFFLVYHFC